VNRFGSKNPPAFDPTNPLGLLFGSLAFGVAGSAAYDLGRTGLESRFSTLASEWILFIVFGLLLFGFATIYHQWRRSRTVTYVTGIADDRRMGPKRGLIVFVSLGPSPTAAESAIDIQLKDPNRRLKYCWLLHSEQTTSRASGIAQSYENDGITFEPVLMESIVEPSLVLRKVKQTIQMASDAGLAPDDIVLDITGGIKLVTFGMALAAQDGSAQLQYLGSPRNEDGALAGEATGMRVEFIREVVPADQQPVSA